MRLGATVHAIALFAAGANAGTLFEGHGVRLQDDGWLAPLPPADAALMGRRCNVDRRPKLTREEFEAEYKGKKPVVMGGAPDELFNLTVAHLRDYFQQVRPQGGGATAG